MIRKKEIMLGMVEGRGEELDRMKENTLLMSQELG